MAASSPPPILLKLADGVNRIHVRAAAKKLRRIKGYERVFINQDMTDSERVLDRKLRQKRDELNKSEAEHTSHFDGLFVSSNSRQTIRDVHSSTSSSRTGLT